jgi:hypothetical protein
MNITLQLFDFFRKRFKFINYFLIMVIRQIMTMTNLSIKNDAAVVVRRWLVNKIKMKISIIIDAIPLGKYRKSTYEVNANNTERRRKTLLLVRFVYRLRSEDRGKNHTQGKR